MIDKLPEPVDLELEAVRQRRTMTHVCREAGVSPLVFSRWRRGIQTPKYSNVELMVNELRRFGEGLSVPHKE